MGVPALFRWLSKKYPKIVAPVVEEEEATLPGEDGQDILVPVNISGPNPNGMEFDNLYLDMNGIVHPCTHPEGKPAPETEEEMMVEVFKYTERVVNMIRPRKLLFMAIDGVAPRAKMNQQRSRRFRSAQEAREKYEARLEAEAEWKAMGNEITSETKEAWDSNAITPGTPFMHLLANSLRYWVAQKLNTDPGWKDMQVYISDSSVPGEGEHKIMDFIRRQRVNHGHDPNTKHVIYGLDADLIMLALATHEPHFKVLREDVFFQDTSPGACRICGQEGHYAAQCTGTKAEVKKEPPKKKPFIFLDVSTLREYLEVELNVPQIPFPFSLEQAIDDWVLLIFFVGNDFLPHLPSLEIREGAIDTLLKIWKDELARMGGYLTNHGQLELSRAEIILSGLARREDDIFRRRREAEERQDQNAKRRKLDMEGKSDQAQSKAQSKAQSNGPSPSLNLTADPAPPAPFPPLHASLPPRPDFAARADSIGLGGPKTVDAAQNATAATLALGGSNRDIVANRRAIRMANMSAAEVLKAELGGFQSGSSPAPSSAAADSPAVADPILPITSDVAEEDEIPGLGGDSFMEGSLETETPNGTAEIEMSTAAESFLSGVKRKLEEAEDSEGTPAIPDEDEEPGKGPLALKVNPDGTVEQEDTVKLWEPGYRERYYEQKFGVPYTDLEFRQKITTHYVEGLAWVLHYYYQGTPSWQWYYPYHFAPFAADFLDVEHMDIKFDLGQPFKPFEQLMSVFPAASRKHIPAVFHDLMTDSESPIIDFYPTTFEIDMNGKKMTWQGVALLPFIDENRLLGSMQPRYPNLTEAEVDRNKWGNNLLLVSDDNPLYPSLEALYGKKKSQQPVPMDYHPSKGINGSLLPNPDCIPGSTYYSPLTSQGLYDIANDRSLSAFYFFPKQLTHHRSMLLPGVSKPPRVLTPEDLEVTRRGGRGRGGGDRGGRGGGRGQRNIYMHEGNPREPRYNRDSRNGSYGGGRDYGGGGHNQSSNYSYPSSTPAQTNSYGEYPPQTNNPYQQQGGYRGPPQSSYDSRPPYQQPSYGGSRGGYNSGYDGSYGGGANGYGGRGGGPPSQRGGAPPYGGGGGYGGQGGQQGGGYGYGGHSGGYNQPPQNTGYGRGGHNGGGGYQAGGTYQSGGGYQPGGGYQSGGPYSTGFESYGNKGGYNQRGRGRGRGY